MFVWHLLASTGIGRGQRGIGGAPPPIPGGIPRHGSMLLLLLLLQLLLLMLFVLLLPLLSMSLLPLLLFKLFICQWLASMRL